jgi:NAD(P)-dependent dehydrogenase (short-subunit alcohol dehydrogenase family)
MQGRIAVVTGANRGLGKAAAAGLARSGARVLLLCRSMESGERAASEIGRETGSGALEVVQVDLASQASIRAAASRIRERHDALHALVNNAGVNLARRTVTEDGLETTLAVNHLAPFLLTTLLLPALERGAQPGRSARVVTVTSIFERFGRIDFDDLQGERRYLGLRAYMQSKLANILFTRSLSRRVATRGITATCADPGLVGTDLLRDRLWYRIPALRALWRPWLADPVSGARAALLAASSPALEGVTGECIDRRGRVMRTSRRSRDDRAAERLWRLSEELTRER